MVVICSQYMRACVSERCVHMRVCETCVRYVHRRGLDDWIQGMGCPASSPTERHWLPGSLPGLPQLPTGEYAHDLGRIIHQLGQICQELGRSKKGWLCLQIVGWHICQVYGGLGSICSGSCIESLTQNVMQALPSHHQMEHKARQEQIIRHKPFLLCKCRAMRCKCWRM